MKITEENFISDAHFDVLLRHALLEKEQLFNNQTLETMGQNILAADYAESTDSVSASNDQTIVEKLAKDFNSGGSKFRLNIFLLSIFTVVTIVTVIFFTSKNQLFISQSNSNSVVTKDNATSETANSLFPQELIENPLPRTNPAMIVIFDSAKKEDSFAIQNINNGNPYNISTILHIPEDRSLHYEDVPTLTEVQKKQTAKDKLKMIRDIANPKKKVYSIVPSGKTPVNGVITTVHAFYIKNSEVTNFEYRTFLNDLLVQGKFDDYLLAKPVSGGWKTAGIPKFEDLYFESITYKDFPAVNMTRKGAELYCKWLTNEVSAAIQNKEVKWPGMTAGKTLYTDFRIPTNVEWIYAARGGDSTSLKYPWGKTIPDSVHNRRGCFLCNFNYTSSKDYFKGVTICPGFGKLKQGGFHQPIITSAGMAIDTLLTAPVYSYNPNTTGQYCIMGNVSEMAWTYDVGTKTLGPARAMGGNWNSYVDNIRIEAAEQYVGLIEASAYIGFRPIMTFIVKRNLTLK